MNTSDLELLSQSWDEPELARAVADLVSWNGRLPQRHELLERLTRVRIEPEAVERPVRESAF